MKFDESLKKLITEEHLKKIDANELLNLILPPVMYMQDRIKELEEELRVAKIRNEEQAKVLDGIVKALKV